MSALTNLTFDQIDIGASLVIHHTVTRHEVELMALVSGEANPFAPRDGGPAEEGPVCEGVSAEALVHGMLKRQLPGPGTVILSHQLVYGGTARMGDALMATVTVVEKQAPDQLTFDCQVRHADALLLSGAITVRAPSTQQTVDERDPVDVVLRRNDVFGRLFRECAPLPPVSCAVVHPCDASALRGALEAARHGVITPVLVGPQAASTRSGRAQRSVVRRALISTSP